MWDCPFILKINTHPPLTIFRLLHSETQITLGRSVLPKETGKGKSKKRKGLEKGDSVTFFP